MRGIQIPEVVVLAFACDLSLSVISLSNALYGSPSHKLGIFLNVDAESNLPTWYASMKHFVVSVMLGFAAWRQVDHARRWSWLSLLLPAAFLMFSIDEVAMFHDWLGYRIDALSPALDRRDTPFALTGVWGIVVGVPCLIGVAVLVRLTRGLYTTAPYAYLKVIGGSFIFVAGAAGVDFLQNFVAHASRRVYVLTTHAEELLEMASISLVFWGAYELLSSVGFAVHRHPLGSVRAGRPTGDAPLGDERSAG